MIWTSRPASGQVFSYGNYLDPRGPRLENDTYTDSRSSWCETYYARNTVYVISRQSFTTLYSRGDESTLASKLKLASERTA